MPPTYGYLPKLLATPSQSARAPSLIIVQPSFYLNHRRRTALRPARANPYAFWHDREGELALSAAPPGCTSPARMCPALEPPTPLSLGVAGLLPLGIRPRSCLTEHDDPRQS